MKSLLLCFALSQGLLSASVDAWTESYKLEYEKQYDKAIKVLNSQVRSGEYVMIRIGYLNYLKGNYAESLKQYQSAVNQNQLSVDARLGMVAALIALKRWNEAANEAQKVINANAWNQTACLRLLACREAMNQWDQVVYLGRELVKRYPSDVNALLYWARGEARTGNRNEAKKAYQRVLQAYPGQEEALQYFKN